MNVTVTNKYNSEVRTFIGVKSISIDTLKSGSTYEYIVLVQTEGICTYIDSSVCEITRIKLVSNGVKSE